MARSGTKIIVAEVPVTPELARVRPSAPEPVGLLEKVQLVGTPGVEAIPLTGRLPRSAYCDYSHLDPARDAAWQEPFFRAASDTLDRIGADAKPLGAAAAEETPSRPKA